MGSRKWIDLLARKLGFLVRWPDQDGLVAEQDRRDPSEDDLETSERSE
jgi:hypothetical protein